MREAVNIVKRHRRTLSDRRTTPVPEMPQVSDERALAAKSVEILAMPQRSPEEPPEKAPVPAAAALVPPAADHAKTEQLLTSILEQLRRTQMRETFGEFSLTRLVAGIVQAFVPLCLLLALWFLMGSKRQDSSVFLVLSFAAVLQVMALTFYIMHDRR
jgi:hypothetical protein